MSTNPISNSPEANACIQQGLEASRADRVDEAMACFRRAAELAPSTGLPHFLIGAELAQLGRMDEAEAAYANAVLLAPELDMARYQLGLLQFTSGRPGVALVTWGPLFQLPGQHPLQRVVHGFAALAQNHFDAAVACFREAMALNRENLPLNRDLQMMIDRIEGRPQVHPAADSAMVASPGDEVAPTSEDGLHVLLANYQRGPLH
jgi:Flp pilus assembly protein TadD